MTFQPIVARELRVHSRRATTQWLRWAVAVAAGLLVFQILFFNDSNSGGRQAYQMLLGIGCVLAGAGALLTADAVSRERRDGTLGFLFLTDLNGHDVALGKFVASGLTAFYALIGLAPALALPVLAGGVNLSEVARATVSLLHILFVSLALGLWVSTRAESQYAAIRKAASLILGILLLPMAVLFLPSFSLYLTPLLLLSPLESLRTSFEATFLAVSSNYWWSLFLSQLEGCCFLLLAARNTARTWRESTSGQGRKADVERTARWPRLSPRETVSWRASQLSGQGTILWSAAGLVALQGFPFLLFASGFLRTGGFAWLAFYQGGVLAMQLGSAGLFAWAGARFFLETRRSGELELLASTPVGAQELVSGQWTALWQRLRWVVLFLVFVVGLPSAVRTLMPGYGAGFFPPPMYLLRSLLTLVGEVVSVLALVWLGMWLGLRVRRPLVAVAAAVAIVDGLPWLVFSFSSMVMAWGGGRYVTGGGLGGLPGAAATFVYLGLPLVFFAMNLFIIRWTKRSLQHQLRAGAMFGSERTSRGSSFSLADSLGRLRHWTPS